MNVSKKLKILFLERNATQSQVARLAGISEGSLRNKLSRNTFTIEDIIKISEGLGYRVAIIDDLNTIVTVFSDKAEQATSKPL